jgi:hypothetical protein
VATAVAEAAQQLRAELPLQQAQPHLRQARRLEALVRHQPRRQAEPRQLVELPQRVERRRLAAAVVAEVAATSPATPTLMAPLTPVSAKWLATRTACRR